jgi:hypothetical protein
MVIPEFFSFKNLVTLVHFFHKIPLYQWHLIIFWSSMAKLHPDEKQLLCYLLALKQRVLN